jgi:DNA-binding response OmpR family regulator
MAESRIFRAPGIRDTTTRQPQPMNPRILLLCHDLGTRLQLTAAWTAAGATMLAPASTEVPDCIVVDLGRRDALGEIARLRSLHPGVGIISCGASFDEAAVTAAKAAGADDFAARSFVDRRVSRLLKLQG